MCTTDLSCFAAVTSYYIFIMAPVSCRKALVCPACRAFKREIIICLSPLKLNNSPQPFNSSSSPCHSLTSPLHYALPVTSLAGSEVSLSFTAAMRHSEQMVRASGSSSHGRLFNLHFRCLADSLIGSDSKYVSG